MNNILLKFLFICLPFFSVAQDIQFRAWNGTTYGSVNDFPPNAVADDFGPRRYNDNFHGGVDFNSVQSDGNSDKWDMILAPETGTIVNVNRLWTTGFNYKQICYQVGNHRYIFGHVYDNTGASYDENNSTIILTHMSGLDNMRWAQILTVGGETIRYGQVEGQVEVGGILYPTTITVTAGDPLVPLGDADTEGEAHLHLNTIPLDKDYSDGSTTWNSNPLQYLDYDKADYDLSLYSEQNTEAVAMEYPGTEVTPIALKVKMETIVSGPGDKRYSNIFDVDKVEFYMKSGLLGTPVLIQGPNKYAKIRLGGILGEDKLNHPNPSFGNWTTTGVDSRAYNSQYSNQPYDIYHFSDWVSRIHKDALTYSGNNMPTIADCPQSARYKDGPSFIYGAVTNIKNVKEETGDQLFILDNFKPFIESVQIKIGSVDIYNKNWICNDLCPGSAGGIAPNGSGSIPSNPSSLDELEGMTINVRSSEPLVDLLLTIKVDNSFTSIINDALSGGPEGTDHLNWNIQLSANQLAEINALIDGAGTVELIFTGEDFSENQLLNLETYAENNCIQIPTRATATTWTHPNFPQGQEEMHKFDIINCGYGIVINGQLIEGNGNQLPDGAQAIILNGSCVQINIDSNYDPTGDGCAMEFYGSIISGDIVGTPVWLWDFGDGSISSLQNPSHVYSETGNYTVTLTLSDNDGVVGAATQQISTSCNDTDTGSGTTSEWLDCVISGPSIAAAGTTLQLSAMASGGNPPYAYVWSEPFWDGEIINTIGNTMTFEVDDNVNAGDVLNFSVDVIDSYGSSTQCDITVSIAASALTSVKLKVYDSEESQGANDDGWRSFLMLSYPYGAVSFWAEYKFEVINYYTGEPFTVNNDWISLQGWSQPTQYPPGLYQVTSTLNHFGIYYTATKIFEVGVYPIEPPQPAYMIYAGDPSYLDPEDSDNQDAHGPKTFEEEEEIISVSLCDYVELSVINVAEELNEGTKYGVVWSYIINNSGDWISLPGNYYTIEVANLIGYLDGEDPFYLEMSVFSGLSVGDCISIRAQLCSVGVWNEEDTVDDCVFDDDFEEQAIANCKLEIVESHEVIVEEINIETANPCNVYLQTEASCGVRISQDYSEIPDYIPCSEDIHYYESYTWKAYSIFPPYFEILEVEGIGELLQHTSAVSNTQFKCIPINFDHPYFDLFEPNEIASFNCKVFVTDHNDNTSFKEMQIDVNRPVDIDLPDEIRRCSGASPLSLNPIAINGQAPYTYEWLEGVNAITGDPNNPMISDELVDGDHVNFHLRVTDNNDCTTEHYFDLIIEELVVDIPEEMNFACAENTQFLPNPIVSGGSGEYTYVWTAYLDSDGLVPFETDYLSDPNVLNPLITPITPPTTSGWEDFVIYYLTVTDVFGDCEATDDIQVKPGELSPVADAGEDQTVCYGTPITIGNPDNGLNDPIIEWTSSSSYFEGSNLPEAEISGDVNRHGGMFNYTVSVTDPEFGCINTDMMQLSVLNVWLKEGFQYEDKYINTSISNPTSVPAWTNSVNKIYTKDELPNSGAIGPFSRVWQLGDPISETIEATGYPSQAYFDPSENQSLKLIVTDESTTCSETFKTNKYFLFGGDDPVAYMSTHLPSPLDCDSPIDICVNIVIDANFTGDIFPMNIEVDPTLDAPPPFADQNLDPIYLTLVDYEETLYEGELCLTVTPGSDDIMFTLSIDIVFDPENFSPPNISPINDEISFFIPTDLDPVPSICRLCGYDDLINKLYRAGELYAGAYPNQGDACQEAIPNCDKAWITNSTLIGKTKVVLEAPPLTNNEYKSVKLIADGSSQTSTTISRIYIDPCLVTEKSLLVNQGGKEEKEESKEKEKIKRNEIVIKGVDETTNEQKEIEESIPTKELSLHVFPNPFDEGLTLSYTISEDALKVSLSIHTLTGQLMSTIVIDEPHKKGRYSKDYSGHSLAPGMYFCELIVDDQKVVKKIIKIETK